jgi:maleate isomerase
MEPELYQHLPPGVTLHTSRMSIANTTAEELLKMILEFEGCSTLLKTAGVNVVLYGCTTGSFVKGQSHDREIETRIEEIAGVPAVTTGRAVVEALKARGLKKIAVVTPYIEELDEMERQYLTYHGFEVKTIKGLGIVRNLDIGKCEPTVAYHLGREVVRSVSDVDGLFISCTNFRTFEIIESLSLDLGKPVITSNQASLWMALKMGGIPSSLWGLTS